MNPLSMSEVTMPREEKAIFTNMCMIYDDAGNVLVQDRQNPDWPGLTFPGGHVEYAESFSQSVIREVKEETGLDIKNPVLCGVKQFQTLDDARYVVLLFKTNQFKGTLTSSEEGNVFFLPRRDLKNYTLANGFEEMLRIFESDSLSELYYYKANGNLAAGIF